MIRKRLVRRVLAVVLCLPLAPQVLTAAPADGAVLTTERHFADFLDAHGALETIASGLMSEVDGRDRAGWQQRYQRARSAVQAGLRRHAGATLPPEEQRVVAAMQATFAELADESMTPRLSCRAAANPRMSRSDLQASLYACFDEIGNRLRFEDRELTRSDALQLLQELGEPARRRALFEAMAPLWRAIHEPGSKASPYRRLVAQVAGGEPSGESPADVVAAALGIPAADIETWLVEVLEAWRRNVVAGRPPIEPWDFRHAHAHASRTLNRAVPRERLEALNAAFMRDLGADPQALGVLFDLEPRPGKAPIAYADAVRIGRATAEGWRPAVARISGNYTRGGLFTLNELVHESGHAVHIAAIRARPAFFWPATLFMEAFADVPSWSLFEPAWQQKYLGTAVARAAAFRELYSLVMLDVAWGLFEIRMLRDPRAEPNQLWTDITSRYLGIAPHPEEAWWAVRAQLVGNPGYMVNYAVGAVLTADLRAALRRTLGPFDAGHPEWYATVSQRLLQAGASIELPQLLRDFLGRPVSPAALIAELDALTATPALTTAPFRPDSASVAVRCGTLIDGLADHPVRDATVVIRAGRIVEVGPGVEPPGDLPLLDLGAHTCLPGLIDMHTHLTDRPEDTADLRVYLRRSAAEQQALAREQARATLLAGFTSVRNLGAYRAWSDRTLRDAIDRGESEGPRMQVTGFYLTVPRGGGDLYVPGVEGVPAEFRGGVARGPGEFRRKARAALEGGADVLKVIASGAVLAYGGVPGAPEMTPAELRAVISEAHDAGRKVAAHAHGARSIREAILAGADTIEHASLIDDAGLTLARERGVALSMDVYNGDYIDTEGRRQGWPAEFLRKNLETTEAQRQAFSRALAVGVPIVYGTDAGVFPHGENARQFEIMVARGMAPMRAIQSATSVAARYMGWDDRIGTLSRGRFGDLIAVRGDPLADIGRLRQVEVVLKGGHLFRDSRHPAGKAQ